MATFLDNLNAGLSNPMFGMGVGLMSGGDTGGTLASGMQKGLMNSQAMTAAQQRQEMQAAAIKRMEEETAERERIARVRESALQSFQPMLQGTPQQTEPFKQDLFPGEQPQQGLMNVTQQATPGLMQTNPFMANAIQANPVGMSNAVAKAQMEQQFRAPPNPSAMREYLSLTPDEQKMIRDKSASGAVQINMGGAVPPPTPMTNEEKARFGLGPNQGAYVTSKGEIKTVTPASKEGAVLKARTENAVQDYHTGVDMIYGDDGSVDRTMLATTRIPGTPGNTYYQAVNRGVETLLRIATGAAAPDAEVKKYADMYAPSVLDSDAAIKNKIESFDRFMSLIQKHSGMGEMTEEQVESAAKESGINSGAVNWSDM